MHILPNIPTIWAHYIERSSIKCNHISEIENKSDETTRKISLSQKTEEICSQIVNQRRKNFEAQIIYHEFRKLKYKGSHISSEIQLQQVHYVPGLNLARNTKETEGYYGNLRPTESKRRLSTSGSAAETTCQLKIVARY
ncbi:hypothetical protein HHI36_006964 [Cryptolaemus montrouzieri]|uniref:Uncharacterized protein n=1 Tax=Cryptolaemus montrouzieri TaxID=559131 RepID=A0ABD2MNB2_9CUCU